MTEAEWLGSADPRAMVLWLKRAMRPRKFRLFVCACCRSLWDEVTPPQFRDAGVDQAAVGFELLFAGTAAPHGALRPFEVRPQPLQSRPHVEELRQLHL